jgi:hypothetical protein
MRNRKVIAMKNITIALDEKVIEAGRKYAQRNNTSLNGLIRSLLEQTVMPSSQHWLDECFELMDQAQAKSRGSKWKREDLYRV